MEKLKIIIVVPIAIIIVFIIIMNIGKANFQNEIQKNKEKILASNLNINNDTIKKEDLPDSVSKWLTKVGVFKSKRIKNISLNQEGLMKLSQDQKEYYKPKAYQLVNVIEPGFLWTVDISMMPLINTKGMDFMYDGKGSMQVKVGYIIPVVNEKPNKKINESTLSRYLLELPWYPTAALESYMSWEKVTDHIAEATINYKGIETRAKFFFDEDFQLIKIEALRYKELTEGAERKKCIGEIKTYTKVDDLLIPDRIDVAWIENDQKFTWYIVQANSFDINYY